jgi:glycosyltransferase involved in cell wall biosynthesis
VLSVIILTFNDEAGLPQCLASLAGLASEVFVVDSGSSDRTAEIAQSLGVTVVKPPFAGAAAQRNWAIENLRLRGPWVLHLEADEQLSPELRTSIAEHLAETADRGNFEVGAFSLRPRLVFMKRRLRHGGLGTSVPRLHRLGKARFIDDRGAARLVVDGEVAALDGDLVRIVATDLTGWIAACNRRSELEARLAEPRDPGAGHYRRWLFIRAFCDFIWRYCGRLGFLDGREGLIFHFMQDCWYPMLVDAKRHDAALLAASRSQPPAPRPLAPASARKLLSVVILTRDEELNLPACLASFAGLDCEIFIVDSGSTDRTLEIARAYGCLVFQHPWQTYAAQLNWALENLPIATPWTMRMDADEWITPALRDELREALASAPDDVGAMMVKRRVYFWGGWIRHGGYYPFWLLRVWRSGRARCEPVYHDEHIIVDGGRILHLRNDVVDENRKGLGFWIDKHNRYSNLEVRNLLALQAGHAHPRPAGQAGRRRWAKERIYARAPLFGRAFLYWFLRYFMLLGFLDGAAGAVFHFLQGFWYRFVVDAKLYEAAMSAGQMPRAQAQAAESRQAG